MSSQTSTAANVNPQQNHTTRQQLDQFLRGHIKHTSHSITTCQFSTQVNMDEENLVKGEDPAARKKNKKREYKRKKKEKKKEDQESARICLSHIISLIYQRTTDFQTSREPIEASLNQLIGGEKFHMFLNDAIKLHVKNMQKDIWDFMQSIIKQNSLEKNSDDQEFYVQMIDYVYGQFSKLKLSSAEIQKIINTFMCINSNSTQHMNDQYGLDRSTFKFMIESDETIKNLLKICHRRIFPINALQLQRIKQLTQLICKTQQDLYFEEEYEETTEKSTSVDDEDKQDERVSKKKKKKRKLRESDFRCGEDEVVQRLNQMVIIEEKRARCGVSQDWMSRLAHRYLQK